MLPPPLSLICLPGRIYVVSDMLEGHLKKRCFRFRPVLKIYNVHALRSIGNISCYDPRNYDLRIRQSIGVNWSRKHLLSDVWINLESAHFHWPLKSDALVLTKRKQLCQVVSRAQIRIDR